MATLPDVVVTGTVIEADWGNDVRSAITENPAYLATAKGDVFVATGSGVVVRVAVGTNDYALVADSAQAAGVKWGQVSAILKTAGAGHALLPAGPAAATTVADNAAGNTYGSYVEMRSAAGNAIYILWLHVTNTGNFGSAGQFMIGTGGAGSETAVSEIGVSGGSSGGAWTGVAEGVQVWPWVAVAASTRVAIKAASVSGGTNWGLKLAVVDQANVAYG